MSIGFYFDVVSGREGTGISFDLKPFVSFIANLTFLTFACNTNKMSTLVTAYLLFSNLFPAYPATKSVI